MEDDLSEAEKRAGQIRRLGAYAGYEPKDSEEVNEEAFAEGFREGWTVGWEEGAKLGIEEAEKYLQGN